MKDKPLFSVIIAQAPGRRTEAFDAFETMDYNKSKYEIIAKEGPNGSENRNLAISEAKGEIMAIIDDDALAHSNLFNDAERLFKEHPEIAVFGGPNLTPKDDNFFARVSGYVLSSPIASGKMHTRYGGNKLNLDADEKNLTSAVCFIKKEVFDKIGYFNPKLFPGEDPEFFRRAKKAGFGIGFSPDLYVYHRRRKDLKSFCRQNYGFGKVRIKNNRMTDDRTGLLFLAPSALLLYVIAAPFLALFSEFLLLPLMVYCLYLLFSAFYISAKNRDAKSLFLIPVIIASMHLSYGAGMISGLLNQKKD